MSTTSSQRSAEERAAKRPSTRPSGIPPSVILYAGALPSAKRHSYATCYQTHLAEARALPASQVTVFRGDARVALANVRFGMDNVCGDLDAIARHLPTVSIPLVMSAADVARALVYGRTLVTAKPASTGEIQKHVASIVDVRAEMFVVAARLVRKGVLAADQSVTPSDKEGLPGLARDAVRLARMFTMHASAIQGMHPFSAEEIRQLGADGEWLLETLKPAAARTRAPERAGTASDDCDRLGRLLVQRHGLLRKIGYHFHGDDFDAVVPPLLSSTHTPMADETVDPPAPPPTT